MPDPLSLAPLSLTPLGLSPLSLTALGAAEEGGGGGSTDVATITVPASSVGSDLTGFPTPVDLSDMPAAFWSGVDSDGGNIRILDASATRLPVDVVRIDTAAETGWLWFGPADLSSSVDTEFTLDLEGTAQAVGDTYGRNAVWAGYDAVVALGAGDLENRTGGNDAVPAACGSFGFALTATQVLTSQRQGIAWDDTNYFSFNTNQIRKYDAAFSALLTNSDPLGDAGIAGLSHMGDGCVVGGHIWVGMVKESATTSSHLVKIDKSDLSHVTSYDITAQSAASASSVAYNPDDGLLYVASYADGSKLFKYDPADGSYQGALTFSTTFGASSVQGITFFRGFLYVADGSTKKLYQVTTTGTRIGPVYGSTAAFNPQGVDYNNDGLLQMEDRVDASPTLDALRFLTTMENLSLAAGGGTRNGVGGRLTVNVGANAGRTTFTMGVSFGPADDTQDSMVAFAPAGTADTHRIAAAVDDGDKLAVWDTSNSWLYCSPNVDPALEPTMHRLHVVYKGTTERRIYHNGTLGNTDSTITAKGGGGGATMYLVIGDGVEGGSSSTWIGRLGLAYLRPADLGTAWIAAEYAALADNSSFLTIAAP